MKMCLATDHIEVAQLPQEQYRMLTESGSFRYESRKRCIVGPINADNLDLLASIQQLPADMEIMRWHLHRQKDALNAERMKPDDEVRELYPFPVKAKLFRHQVRGANMALIAFGMNPETGRFD